MSCDGVRDTDDNLVVKCKLIVTKVVVHDIIRAGCGSGGDGETGSGDRTVFGNDIPEPDGTRLRDVVRMRL